MEEYKKWLDDYMECRKRIDDFENRLDKNLIYISNMPSYGERIKMGKSKRMLIN